MASQKKSKAQSPKSKVRACLRCGCTEDRACGCGCEWVAGVNVCSACLTKSERTLWQSLLTGIVMADQRGHDARTQQIEARNRLNFFGQLICIPDDPRQDKAEQPQPKSRQIKSELVSPICRELWFHDVADHLPDVDITVLGVLANGELELVALDDNAWMLAGTLGAPADVKFWAEMPDVDFAKKKRGGK